MTASTTTRLFVYGTLMCGECNHRLFATSRCCGSARTLSGFRMYSFAAFPGVVRATSGVVMGEVYEVDPEVLVAVDRLEGVPHFYRRSTIILDDGSSAEAYLLRPDQVEGNALIPSGSWRARHKKGGRE